MTTTSPVARVGALIAVLAAAVLLATWLLGSDDRRPSALVPATEGEDPFAYDADRREDFERRAALGLSHVLYAKSPGGAVATAKRVVRYRPLIE